jgi:hypothetical protein
MILSSCFYMRVLAAVCLTVGMVSCRSNLGPADSGGFIITDRLAEAQSSTVPADSSNFQRAAIKHDNWSQRTSWEFNSKLSRTKYAEWVTSRLRSDYKAVKSSGDTIVFVRNVNGDTEAVVIHLNGGGESLHVRVELSFAPD